MNGVTFCPFLVKSHLYSFGFARNIYGKSGLEQKALMIPFTYWKFGWWEQSTKAFKVRNSKRLKNFMRSKRIHFLSSVPSTVNITTHRNVRFIPHSPLFWGSVRLDIPRALLLCPWVRGWKKAVDYFLSFCQVGFLQWLSLRNAMRTQSAIKWSWCWG